jgi:hypothetical protein
MSVHPTNPAFGDDDQPGEYTRLPDHRQPPMTKPLTEDDVADINRRNDDTGPGSATA